ETPPRPAPAPPRGGDGDHRTDPPGGGHRSGVPGCGGGVVVAVLPLRAPRRLHRPGRGGGPGTLRPPRPRPPRLREPARGADRPGALRGVVPLRGAAGVGGAAAAMVRRARAAGPAAPPVPAGHRPPPRRPRGTETGPPRAGTGLDLRPHPSGVARP